MDLSIIIVNWNSLPFLRKCLLSIYRNVSGIAFEVIVIDNASTEECAEVRQQFEQVVLICSKTNMGFGAANNLGASLARGDNLLFLNPDTEVLGNAVQKLYLALNSQPAVAIAGAKLLNSDLTLQTSCVQAFPTILNQVLDSDALRTLFPKWRIWGTSAFYAPPSCNVPVDAVSGACLMIKKRVFDEIGGFSAQFFMYSEDVDLCLRTRKAGWGSCYLGSAEVLHHGGRSSAGETRNNFATVLMRESRLRLLTRWRGLGYARAYRAITAAAALCRVILLRSILLACCRPSRRNSLLSSAEKWTRVFRWAIGLENWATELRNDRGQA